MFHSKGPSDASSCYSSVLSAYTAEDSDSEVQPEPFVFPKRDIKNESYQIHNPYAGSLWYGTRGEVGNETIEDIKKRTKRKLVEEHTIKVPPRLESLAKKVDSPIRNEAFSNGLDDVVCDSPKYKGLKPEEETKYRQAFKELMVTEAKYLEDLKLTDTVYRSILTHSKKYKHILSHKQEAVIFSNLETITDLSALFIRDVTKEMSSSCNYFEFDIQKHFGLVDLTNIDIGDYLKNYFIRLSIAYSSYFKNHRAQMAELEYCSRAGGPKVVKWLDECAYLAKSKSDCWGLESLLIKPVQRLPKYLLMIDVLLENSEGMSYGNVEHLYDAKSYLERLLDGLNATQTVAISREEPEESGKKPEVLKDARSYFGKLLERETSRISHTESTEDVTVPRRSQEKTPERAAAVKDSRQEYVELVNQFKVTYNNFKKLRHEVKESYKPMFKFMSYHKGLIEKWRHFMEYDDEEDDDCYIKSIYSAYSEKLNDQESKTKLLTLKMDEKIIKAIDLALDNCAAVKYRIKKHNANRGAYVRYIKGQTHMTETARLEAQEYIVIENQIKDDLPPLLQKMSMLLHYFSLLYAHMFQDWLKMMSGENRLGQYQEMVEAGEIQPGDNFDIIELYSSSKHGTRAALKDLCSHSSPYSENGGEIRIHSSRVVRKLFGV